MRLRLKLELQEDYEKVQVEGRMWWKWGLKRLRLRFAWTSRGEVKVEGSLWMGVIKDDEMGV